MYTRKIDSLVDIFEKLNKNDSDTSNLEIINDKIKHNEILEGLKNRSIDLINLENNIKVIEVLKLVLRTRPLRFVCLLNLLHLHSAILI